MSQWGIAGKYETAESYCGAQWVVFLVFRSQRRILEWKSVLDKLNTHQKQLHQPHQRSRRLTFLTDGKARATDHYFTLESLTATVGEPKVICKKRFLKHEKLLLITILPTSTSVPISILLVASKLRFQSLLMEGETPPSPRVHAITSSDPSTDPSSDVSDNLDGALTLSLRDRANFFDDITGFRATTGALIYGCIKNTAELHKSIRHYGPSLSKLLKNIPIWICANPRTFIRVLGSITLCVLPFATPAILGAVGFSAAGPVAGTIAAGWQASIGSVAAGSLFAFLQSAAMGGTAMGALVGIGAFGGVIMVGVELGSLKKPIAKLAEDFKGPVSGLVGNFKRAMGGSVENTKAAMGGLAENFMNFFGKTKDD